MIGLIDCDMSFRGSKFFPNLDLMKLYSYYKGKNCPRLLNPLDSADDYNELFIWKDTKESKIEDKFWEHQNITTGGLYFTNGIYRPFSNIDIENSSPSYRLYNEFFKLKLNTPSIKRLNINIVKYLYAGFIRINSPGKLQTDQLKKKGNLYIYDTGVLTKEYIDILEDFANYVGKMFFCYPIYVKSQEDFERIIEKKIYTGSYLSTFNERLIIDFNVPMDSWLSFLKEHSTLFDSAAVASVALNAVVDYSKCNFHTKKWYSNFVKEIINKWMISYINGIDLAIHYERDSKNPYDDVLYEFIRFATKHPRKDITFFERVKYKPEILKMLKELYGLDTIYSRYLHLPIQLLKEEYYDKSRNSRTNSLFKRGNGSG